MNRKSAIKKFVAAVIVTTLLVTGVWFARILRIKFREKQYESLITQVSQKHSVDPYLIKAIVWRESLFRADRRGTSGEYGLMQVMPIAAEDWVNANRISGFENDHLFDPKTNLEVGTWYIARALKRYTNVDNPLPFALAEYNAGRRTVLRWMGATNAVSRPVEESSRFTEAITYPSTRKYIHSVLSKKEEYELASRKY